MFLNETLEVASEALKGKSCPWPSGRILDNQDMMEDVPIPTWSSDDDVSGVDMVALASALGRTGVLILSGVLLLMDDGLVCKAPCKVTSRNSHLHSNQLKFSPGQESVHRSNTLKHMDACFRAEQAYPRGAIAVLAVER